MLLQRTAAFCPDVKYFACINNENRLLVWNILSNYVEVDCKLDPSVYGACKSLYWISLKHGHPSPKKARLTRKNTPSEDKLLALGTVKGDILLYNITAKNIYSHLVARHSDSVNDMCFHRETDLLYTCSNDKSIAIWDITSGTQKSKWIADDAPVSSICVLNENNLLSASTAILLWDIAEKSILKRFNGDSTEIFKLLQVNASLSLKSCYFLSAAISDSKVNAWSLNSDDCQTPVASFVSTGQPKDINISNFATKNKPLILSILTEDGFFNIFEHTLNGNVSQPLHPKKTIQINSNAICHKPKDTAIICTKLCNNSESVIIVYGSSKDDVIFKHIRIKDLLSDHPQENEVSKNTNSKDKLYITTDSNKVERNVPINGLKSSSRSPGLSPKAVKLKDMFSLVNRPETTNSSNQNETISTFVKDAPINESCQNDLEYLQKSNRKEIMDSDITDPKSHVGMLLKGLQTRNEDLINAVLHSNDVELINDCIKNLPLHTLKYVLEDLNSRFRYSQKSSSTVRKWLKEILRVHLSYLTKCPDTVEILSCIKNVIEVKKVNETVSKIFTLKGLLSLQIQNSSTDESDSDSEEYLIL